MDDNRRCTAKSKQSGERCKRAATPGANVCAIHGGKTPAVVAAAERRLKVAAAERVLATYGLPVEVDPLNALLGELHRTAGHVAWLGLLIAELEHDEEGRSGLRQWRPAGEDGGYWAPSVWVELYQRERAHLARVASDCLKAGVEERRVRLAEDQGRLVADTIRRIVVGLGLDPASDNVREIVRRELTLVAGGAA